MVIMNNQENKKILKLDLYHEILLKKRKGIDIINGNNYDLSESIELKPKSILILELE